MVATVGSIQVIFDAQYGPAVASLRRFASESERTGRTTEGALRRIDKASIAANRSMGALNGTQFRTLTLSALRASNSVERLRGILLATSSVLGGFTAAFAVRGLQEYSDTYRTLNNQIRTSIGEGGDLAKTQEDIFQSAQRSRGEYEATAKLFSRINVSAKRLNIAQKDSLRATETIQKAFALGGSTPVEATQSAIQLSQGIASNKLGGDELRSVLENQALGQLLANQITDGDIGKLREQSQNGALTAGVIVRAFLKASDSIDEMFKNSEQTVAQAFQRIDNALLKYVGTNENVQSGMSATVSLANALADNIDGLADAILFLGTAAAGIFGSKKLGELKNYVSGVRAVRAEAIASAAAIKKAADADAAAAANRLQSARLGVANIGNIADSSSAQKLNQIRSAEFARIQALKDEREAAKNAAGAELQRAIAIKDGTKASLIQAQQTASNKGFIADSEANKAANKQLQADLERYVVLKQQRDEIEAAAKIRLDDATRERDAIRARQQALRGDRASESLTLPGGASVLGNVNKDLERAERSLTKAQEGYNEALRATATSESELNHIRQNTDIRDRVQVLDNQSEAQKGLSAAYREHVIASRAAADAEAAYAKSLRDVKDVSRVQGASDRRLGQEETFLRGDIQAEARKQLAEATKANAIATARATVANTQFNSILGNQNAIIRNTTAAFRLLGAGVSYVTNFLGGPLGVALVALSGYLAYTAYQAQKSKDAMDYYSTALDQTALAAAKTTSALNTLAASQERVRAARAGGASEQLGAVEDTKGRIATLVAEFNDLSGAQIRNAGTSRTAAIAVMKLRKEFTDGKITVEGFQAGLDAISADNPGFADVAAAMLKVARAIAIARGELAALLSGFDQVPGGPTAKTDRIGDRVIPTDIKNKLAEDLRASTEERLGNQNEARTIDPLYARFYGLGNPTSKLPGGSKSDKPDPFGDAMKSTKEDIDALRTEAQVLQNINPLIDDHGRALAAAKEAQELLTAAQKGGQAVGKELTDVQQLLYGDISKLSPAAQQQALAIRQMALAYGDAEANVNKLKEAQENAKAAMEFTKELISSSLATFRQSIIEGKSVWQALGDVALSVLDKIAAKLEEMIADNLVKSLLGGTTTSSSTGGFNILSLFGLGGTTSAFPAAPGGGMAAALGWNAAGTKSWRGGPTVVGEKGPEIIDAPAGSRITPNSMLSEELDRLASQSIGFQASPAAAAVDQANGLRSAPPQRIEVFVRKDGNWAAQVAGISARTAAPMMHEGVKHFTGTELPRAMDSHNQTPRRRRVAAA